MKIIHGRNKWPLLLCLPWAFAFACNITLDPVESVDGAEDPSEIGLDPDSGDDDGEAGDEDGLESPEVVDPCEAVTCSEHGACEVRGGEPWCVCHEGYENLDALTCIQAECLRIPEEGEIGGACTSDTSCDEPPAACNREFRDAFLGQTYIENHDGACLDFSTSEERCSPTDPSTCPGGSRCVYLGTCYGPSVYGCLDECAPADASGNPQAFNCGCRLGYQCDPILHGCVSGCSNDRECCEAWDDENWDLSRQDDEVILKEGCTNICDNGGLYEGEDPEDFAHTFACINNGDPTNIWGGPCLGDAWCPPDGRCLNYNKYPSFESYCCADCWPYLRLKVDPFRRLLENHNGTENFPGGFCTRGACDHAGRGCSENGGACGGLKTPEGPLNTCLATCRFGRSIDEPGYECRTTEGQEQACVPVDPDFWVSPPDGDADGYCWPGNFAGTEPIGSPCDTGESCESPYGLGTCFKFNPPEPGGFCSVHCSIPTARDFSLCGGDDGTGAALAACYWGTCWEGCSTPGAAVGESDCTQIDETVCYATSIFGPSAVQAAAGLELPPGLCMPHCSSDRDCTMLFAEPRACDVESGFCI